MVEKHVRFQKNQHFINHILRSSPGREHCIYNFLCKYPKSNLFLLLVFTVQTSFLFHYNYSSYDDADILINTGHSMYKIYLFQM